jgi:hypothetical protein
MGQVKNYFPRTSFHKEIPDFFNLDINKDINNVSAVEHRDINSIPKFTNALYKTVNYLKQTGFVVNVAPKLKALMQLFNKHSHKELY